jgi:hypothetical protein
MEPLIFRNGALLFSAWCPIFFYDYLSNEEELKNFQHSKTFKSVEDYFSLFKFLKDSKVGGMVHLIFTLKKIVIYFNAFLLSTSATRRSAAVGV